MIESNDERKQTTVDDDIARMRNDFKMGRFSDFDGMDTMTVLKRSEYIRHSLYEDKKRLPKNANRIVNEIMIECDREDYFPNVHLICEKMIASSKKRYEEAESTFATAQNGSNIRPGKKAIRMRSSIDAKCELAVSKQLFEERKKIDAQKKEMEKYIKMAPDSPYAAMIVNVLKQNEESYQLTSRYLAAQAAVEKYERYEKLGVLIEEEKKLRVLAKEREQAAQLRLDNHKQSSYIMQERDALLRFDNKTLMKEAHAGLLNCAKNSLAFIAIPTEITERLLEYGLMESERKYYDVLQTKQNLVGFHPFKKMALNREIQKTAKEYNAGLALLPDTRENKLKHMPLTTLEEWKKQNGVQVEKIAENNEEPTYEFFVEVMEEKPEFKAPLQLNLSDKIHTRKTDREPIAQKGVEKDIPDIEKEH